MKYIFRGLVIFDYCLETHDFLRTEQSIDFCSLITEDYDLLADYFDRVRKYYLGEKVSTHDVEVY